MTVTCAPFPACCGNSSFWTRSQEDSERNRSPHVTSREPIEEGPQRPHDALLPPLVTHLVALALDDRGAHLDGWCWVDVGWCVGLCTCVCVAIRLLCWPRSARARAGARARGRVGAHRVRRTPQLVPIWVDIALGMRASSAATRCSSAQPFAASA